MTCLLNYTRTTIIKLFKTFAGCEWSDEHMFAVGSCWHNQVPMRSLRRVVNVCWCVLGVATRDPSWRCGLWGFCSTRCCSARTPSVVWPRSWMPNSSPLFHSPQVAFDLSLILACFSNQLAPLKWMDMSSIRSCASPAKINNPSFWFAPPTQ